jgi:hypothetical protein
LFREARIVHAEGAVAAPRKPIEECDICCVPNAAKSMTGLDCGHR